MTHSILSLITSMAAFAIIATVALACMAGATSCSSDRSTAVDNSAIPGPLHGKIIAILADDGFEQAELLEPRKALNEAGATTVLISEKSGTVKAWNKSDWGTSVPVDITLDQAKPESYDALVLPGGVMNPDHLRINKTAVAFAHAFLVAGKPIAAICHGPWLLVEAGGISGKTMTSWPSLRSDLTNAGAKWVDKEVVVDGNLVTSRKPDDIPAFNEKLILLLSTNRENK